jgi:YaiO family outer membrane protein
MYYTHNTKLYSYGMVAYSNKTVFPQLRAAYSIFKTFKKDFEVELGGRYLNLDSISSISGVVSVAKPFGDFWVNLRGFVISESAKNYTAFNLTTRYYMNRRQDYLQVVAGLGTSPDDRSRLVNFPNLAGLLTHSIGAGYQKVFHYRTTLGLYGTWINQKISDTGFQNQYDIYVTLQRKF